MVGDVVVILIGYALPVALLAEAPPASFWRAVAEVSAITLAGAVAVRQQGLWWQRVISVRMLELSRIPRAFVVASILAAAIDRKATMNLRFLEVAVAAAVGTLVFILWRSAYRAFLTAERRRGRIRTNVVLVGSGRRAAELRHLFALQPELGYHVAGIIGRRDDLAGTKVEGLWLGDLDQAASLVARAQADLVIVCSSDLDSRLVHELTRTVWAQKQPLFVDAGLPGVDFRRVRSTAVAHQTLLEVDKPSLPFMEQRLKRVFDLIVATLVAAIALPVCLAIALAIKLDDGGPVFFRQRRVGLHGKEFGIWKFRTMSVDAEARKDELAACNERVGPLFKMDDSVDPRITRVGRFVRALSLDELPQLLNVLVGQMSLVGPRPALPKEVGEFPADLLARHAVRPGITGLWQVEARDNKEFEVYRRLDLFYVENWSTSLDLMILIATVDHVVFRPLLARVNRRQDLGDAAPVEVSDSVVTVAART